jgi:SAM-dependent methyltransferase
VRAEHLERLRPVCPACRAAGRGDTPLELGTVARGDGGDVIEGVLVCPERLCRREHPIVDGIPILVVDIASWAEHQLDAVLRRDDLSPFVESLLGDAAGAGSRHDRERSNLSGYGHGHWDDLEPGGAVAADEAFALLVATALALLEAEPSGPWIDVGCAVGRGTLELGRRTPGPVAGVDLSFAMLRVAERMRREGVAVYPQRRVGIVYDRREVAVPDVPSEHLGFWCADAELLPFADGTFAGALSLNVLDCVRSPLGHLLELGRVLAPGGDALLSTPYDWSVAATPLAQWIGGHSQRGPAGGSSAEELRRILSPDAAAGVDTGLTIAEERDGVPWRVYANERSATDYNLHLLRLARGG